MKYHLSVCCIFKDEAAYLEEWLRFYDLIGVDHFYLYDNGSTDDYATVLAPWEAAGKITLHRTLIPAPQRPAYGHCLQNFANESRWIAFVDMDEFLFSPVQMDLRRFLEPFESQVAVAANWVMFGASGHQRKPPGLVTLNYSYRCDINLCTFERALLKGPLLNPANPLSYHSVCSHVKSIVNPQAVVAVCSPHHFIYRDGAFATTAAGRPVSGAFSDEVAIGSLRINHYFSRSWEEFARKLRRGRADISGNYDASRMIERNRLFDQIHDTTICPLGQKVSNGMALPAERAAGTPPRSDGVD